MKAKWEQEKAHLLFMLGGNATNHFQLEQEKKNGIRKESNLKLLFENRILKFKCYSQIKL